MKKVVLPFLGIMAILFLANWGTPENSLDGSQKNSLNFYGTLETWQGQRYNVENISIDHRIKDIPMFEKPLTPENTDQKNYDLKQNPEYDFVKAEKDLHEIRSFEVPDPEHPWVYKKKKSHQNNTYLEIIVTSKDAQQTKTSYLIESRKKIYCDRIIGQVSERRDVPLGAIKRLHIEGFRYCEPDQIRCKPIEESTLFDSSTQPVA